MTPDELDAELRAMLCDGCTVSQLVQQANEVAGDGSPYPRLARLVRGAFGVGPGGWNVITGTESFGTGEVPDSKLTWVFLPAILANRPAWDTDPDRPPAWFDGVGKTPFDDLREVARTSHGLSPDGWAALSDDDREAVRATEATRLELSENVQLLAALAERLQQRVNELERRRPTAVGDGITERQPT